MNMQLASKMRFVSAQLIALLEGDLWLRSAAARQRDGRPGCAAGGRRPARACGSPSRCRRTRCSPSSTADVADRLRERFRFYDWDPATGEVRWMCAFDTTEDDVDAFAAALVEELARG